MVFSSIHCIAWNYTFLSYFEKILWCITSLMTTVVPGLILAIIIYVYLVTSGKMEKST